MSNPNNPNPESRALVDLSTHPDLETIRREKYEKALTALITGKTPKEDFPGGKIPKRPIRGGADVDYIPGWWFDEQGNALFNHLWSYEVQDQNIGETQLWVRGRLTVHIPGRTVTEIFPDGRRIETRHDPINIVKEQYGGSDLKKFTNGPKSGQIMDIADDLKSGATDSRKKCWTGLGFGQDIYGRRELLENTRGSADLSILKKAAAKVVGLDTDEKLDAFVLKETGKKTAELVEVEILGLLPKVRGYKV